jgi:hypothetical protein
LVDTQNGVHVKAGGADIEASDQSISKALESLERIWFGSLDWAALHPIYSACLFALLALIVVLWFCRKMANDRMVHEYRMHRTKVEVQRSLPFGEK